MATYFARKAGNINAADVWATTPAGTAAAVTFASGDVLMANSFAIAVNVSTDLGTTGQVRNDTASGATAGGSFTLQNGVTLTANIFAGATGCIVLGSGTSTIYGNVTGGSAISAGGVVNSGVSASVSIYGNLTGGSGNSAAAFLALSGSTSLIVQGTVTGGSSASASGIHYTNSGNGTINVTGNVTGGTANTACGISTTLTANTVTVTGIVTGGTLAANFGCQVAGVLTVNGIAVGGIAGAGVSTGTGVFATRVVGNGFGPGSVGLTGAPGISNSGTSIVEVRELEYGLRGMSPTVGIVRLKNTGSNTVTFNLVDSGSAKTLIDATANAAMPAASDVRSGVSYASGALTGSCAVPAAGSTALGVPVDAGFGTAVLTPEAVWGAGTRTITGGTVDTLTNAPASVTPADIWSHATRTITGGTVDTLTTAPSVPSASAIASQVRSELSVELARIDAATSTRATPANIPTADIAAIKAKTDALNTTRLAQVSTTEIVGNLLAQANS